MDNELLKIVVSKHFPLLAPALSEINIKEDRKLQYPAGLSYREKTIYINPDSFNTLDRNEKLFVIAHEVMHFLLIHDIDLLKDKRLLLIFNLIRDAQINHILNDQFDFMPKGVITLYTLQEMNTKVKEYFNNNIKQFLEEDEYFIAKLMLDDVEFVEMIDEMIDVLEKYDDNNLDETIQKIKDILNKHGIKDEYDKISKTIVKEYKESLELKNMNSREIEELIDKAMNMLEKGRTISKMAKQNIDIPIKLKRKRITWKGILRETIGEIGTLSIDYDLMKLDRKAWILETYIPSYKKENDKINVVIGIDVSGSISDDEYHNFVNEIYNLMSDINVKGKILLWDTEIEKIIDIENGWNNKIFEKLKERQGYGGTKIKVFFDKANELVKNKRNAYLIILTDGEHEKVEKDWVKDYKKVIFVVSNRGTIGNLTEIKDMKNVYITFLE
jgi:predicted metal-dependent peptidase